MLTDSLFDAAIAHSVVWPGLYAEGHELGKQWSGFWRLAYVSAQVDVDQQSQRIDIVVDLSIDVGDRYSAANSS
jgi:hypothetical protein